MRKLLLFLFAGISLGITQGQVISGVSSEDPADETPQVRQLYIVSPDIIALRIDEKERIVPGITDYVKQSNDVISLSGYDVENRLAELAGVAEYGPPYALFRNVKRDNEFIGYMVGPGKDKIANVQKLVGSTLDKNWAVSHLSYTISSSDDPNFTTVVYPDTVYRKSKPGDPAISSAVFGRSYTQVHEIYLTLPESLEEGKTYTVAFGNTPQITTDITFTFSAHQMRSEAIQVNQNGYAPSDEKIAFLSFWMGNGGRVDYAGMDEFHVYDATDTKVYSGSPTKANNTMHSSNLVNTDVYELDFTTVSAPGRYRVVVPGVGSSYDFDIDESVWERAMNTQIKGFLHQRAGIDLNSILNTYHPRDLHPDDGYIVRYADPEIFYEELFENGESVFDAMQKALVLDSIVPNAWGGYRDAGDFDRQPTHTRVIGPMLNLWEINPTYFEKKDLNIPESGDTIPDIIDEAMWGADIWVRLQQEDGGVPSYIESIEHPRAGEPSWLESLPLVYVPPYIGSTMEYANNTAYLAIAVEKYDTAKARQYKESALKAYQWVLDNKEDHPSRNQLKVKQFAYFGAAMFRLTGEERWQELFKKYVDKKEPYVEELLYILTRNGKEDVGLQNRLKKTIIEHADAIVERSNNTIYHSARNADYIGSTQNMNWPREQAQPLIFAHFFTRDAKYKNALASSYLFSLGANPQNMLYITGLGNRSIWPYDKGYDWEPWEQKPEGIISPGYTDNRNGKDDRSRALSVAGDIYPAYYLWPDAEFFFPYAGNNEHVVRQFTWGLSGWGYLAQENGVFPGDTVKYALNVNMGTGSGIFPEGDTIDISANDPPNNNYMFLGWHGDTSYVEMPAMKNTRVFIPAQSVNLMPLYKDTSARFELIVNRGTGGGRYQEGDTVKIGSDMPWEGYIFNGWQGDTEFLLREDTSNTYAIIPNFNISVEPNFKDTTTVAPNAQLYRAFAFGANTETMPVYNDPSLEYIKIIQNQDNYKYDQVRKYGYTYTGGADHSPNNRGEASCEIYDQFIGCYNQGKMIFRVDVPEGEYKFVLVGGDSKFGGSHRHTIKLRDGSEGEGGMEYTIVENYQTDTSTYFYTDFADKRYPPCEGIDSSEFYEGNSPLIISNQGYIEMEQSTEYDNGGDICLLEVWKTSGPEIFQLNVFNGKQTARYVENEVAAIWADAPEEGQIFDRWVGDVATVENVESDSTTLIMPSMDISVTATFKALPRYTLSVENGTGSGEYWEGKIRSIKANIPPEGESFLVWAGDTAFIDDPYEDWTSITMPAKDITVTATYTNQNDINDIDSPLPMIYPNPATNQLVIENFGMGTIIELFSLSGEKIFNANISRNNHELYVGNLPSGLYILKAINTNGKVNLFKVLKE